MRSRTLAGQLAVALHHQGHKNITCEGLFPSLPEAITEGGLNVFFGGGMFSEQKRNEEGLKVNRSHELCPRFVFFVFFLVTSLPL